MYRLLATLRTDARLQLRNGFYYATGFVLAIYALALSQLPGLGARLAWLVPALVLNNLAITTFYFAGGQVLLEKAEGSLSAQVVTPLRAGEYIASKTLTLTLLSLAYNLAIVALLVGRGVGPALVVGVAVAAAIYTLFGIVAVARYTTLNEYLLPSTVYIGGLMLPILPYALGWDHPLLYLHPIQAPLVLMRSASAPISAWQWAYGLLYSLLWLGLAYRLAHRAFRRHIAQ